MKDTIHGLYEPILKAVNEEPSIHSVRPLATGDGVIDDATFRTLEVDKLFDVVNSSRTMVGQVTLYRSLVQPPVSPDLIKAKQEALMELDADPYLRRKIEDFVDKTSKSENHLYRLLFSKFVGLLGAPSSKMETEGYGHGPYRRGVSFMIDLVKSASELPMPQSSYLKALIEDIRSVGLTKAYSLMEGPVYVTERGVRAKDEKSRFTPAIRFRPTLFKPGLILAMLAAVSLLFYFAPVSAGGKAFSALPMLMFVLMPALLLYVPIVGNFDRGSAIYPLRERYRNSIDLQNALDSLGKVDELLSFRRYSENFGSPTVLPSIVESDKHVIVLKEARNPILGKGNPKYVPNTIDMSDTRLLFITGPNSGGKTAFCKTVAQIQLLYQIGCYVPARDASIAVADRIFYQAPELSSLEDQEGRFGTELKHTKNIFLSTSPRSFVILDELSEGTTYEEKLETSYNILTGFYRIGNNTILITHNHELVENFKQENVGQYRQVEFAEAGPTYRLTQGISHVSHADRVAKRIGFAKEDIERYLAEKGYVDK